MRIVLVSPFPAERLALHELLEGDGHRVISVATADEGLSVALTEQPEVVVADAQIVGDHCLRWIQELAHRSQPALRVICLCARASRPPNDRIVCLTKPIDLTELRRHLAPQRHLRVA